MVHRILHHPVYDDKFLFVNSVIAYAKADVLSVTDDFAVIQMQGEPEMKKKMEESGDDELSDDLSLSIPLPPTPASVCSLAHYMLQSV